MDTTHVVTDCNVTHISGDALEDLSVVEQEIEKYGLSSILPKSLRLEQQYREDSYSVNTLYTLPLNIHKELGMPESMQKRMLAGSVVIANSLGSGQYLRGFEFNMSGVSPRLKFMFWGYLGVRTYTNNTPDPTVLQVDNSNRTMEWIKRFNLGIRRDLLIEQAYYVARELVEAYAARDSFDGDYWLDGEKISEEEVIDFIADQIRSNPMTLTVRFQNNIRIMAGKQDAITISRSQQ